MPYEIPIVPKTYFKKTTQTIIGAGDILFFNFIAVFSVLTKTCQNNNPHSAQNDRPCCEEKGKAGHFQAKASKKTTNAQKDPETSKTSKEHFKASKTGKSIQPAKKRDGPRGDS